ncbi:hypothetical protein C8T65DRAFT_700058 [Cerioporus squamosus]|nr:hypothetical protein C8T65DRAFT_700058 [Cerioporus squamosus]
MTDTRNGLRNPSDGETTTVYARWIGYDPPPLREDYDYTRKVHVYTVTILPERPLEIGMRISIMATSPRWYCDPKSNADEYDTYDAHVVGKIVGVAGWKGRKVILEVANECAASKIRRIRIRVPYAPDATVCADEHAFGGSRREAHEGDLYTNVVVRRAQQETRCQAAMCALPWLTLTGEGFLEEEMMESVADRPGISRGRKKRKDILVGWGESMSTVMGRSLFLAKIPTGSEQTLEPGAVL